MWISWEWRYQNLLKKIQHSECTPTRKQDKLLSPEWVSCTWKLLLTVRGANLKLKLTRVLRRLHIKKRLLKLLSIAKYTRSRRAVAVSLLTYNLKSVRQTKSGSKKDILDFNLKMKLPVEIFPANLFLLLKKVLPK